MSEAEYCDVAEGECVNPAGYGISGVGHAENDDPPRVRFECHECGSRACRKCRRKRGDKTLCLHCVWKHDDAKKLSDIYHKKQACPVCQKKDLDQRNLVLDFCRNCAATIDKVTGAVRNSQNHFVANVTAGAS